MVEDKTTSLLSEWDVQRPVQVCEDEQCGTKAIRFEMLLWIARIMVCGSCLLSRYKPIVVLLSNIGIIL